MARPRARAWSRRRGPPADALRARFSQNLFTGSKFKTALDNTTQAAKALPFKLKAWDAKKRKWTDAMPFLLEEFRCQLKDWSGNDKDCACNGPHPFRGG